MTRDLGLDELHARGTGAQQRLPFPIDLPTGWPQALADGRRLGMFVGLLFAANLLLHYPGTFSQDSLNQYKQALSGEYADWHPPVMAWLWSLWLPLAEGTAPMLVFHLVLHWAGFGLLAEGVRRAGRPPMAWAIAAAGAFPVFLFLNGVITKDVGMAGAWSAAVGLVFWFRAQRRAMPWWAVALAVMLTSYGLLVRTNSIFGLGPLLLYALARATVSWARLAVAGVVVAVLAFPLSNLVNHHLLQAKAQHPLHSLILFDLLGIAFHTSDPRWIAPRVTLTEAGLKTCYTPYWFDPLSPWGRCAQKVNRPDADYIVASEGIERQWLSTIAQNPWPYLKHRLKHFNSSLLFAVPLKHIRLTPEYQLREDGFPAWGPVTASEVRWDLLRKNPLFWPVVWLTWGIALVAFLSRHQATALTGLASALGVSAILYSSAYALIGVQTDMRYHYWSMAALLCASLIVLPELAAGWRERAGPLRAGAWALAGVLIVGTAVRLADLRIFM